MHINTSNTVVLEVTIAGALSGMTAWFVSYPLDAIKANIQGVPLTASRKLEKRHLWPTAKTIFKQKGFFGFYKGVGPTIVRAMIVDSSVRFTKNVQIAVLVGREDLVEGLQELVELGSNLRKSSFRYCFLRI